MRCLMIRFGNACTLLLTCCLAGHALGQELQYSPEGKFHARITKEGVARRAGEINRITVQVLDSQLEERYTIDLDVPFDEPYPDVYVTDRGVTILVNGFLGTAQFFTHEGELLRTVGFFKDEHPEYERVLQADVAGDFVAFLASDPHSAGVEVALYGLDANPCWRKRFAERYAYEISILPPESEIPEGRRFVIFSRYDSRPGRPAILKTSVLDFEGRILADFPLLFRHSAYSSEAEVLGLADQNSVTVVKTADFDRRFRWVIPESESGHVITAVAVRGNGMLVVQSAAVSMGETPTTYRDPSVYFIERDGSLLETRKIDGLQFNSTRMRIEDLDLLVKFDGEREVRMRLTE